MNGRVSPPASKIRANADSQSTEITGRIRLLSPNMLQRQWSEPIFDTLTSAGSANSTFHAPFPLDMATIVSSFTWVLLNGRAGIPPVFSVGKHRLAQVESEIFGALILRAKLKHHFLPNGILFARAAARAVYVDGNWLFARDGCLNG